MISTPRDQTTVKLLSGELFCMSICGHTQKKKLQSNPKAATAAGSGKGAKISSPTAKQALYGFYYKSGIRRTKATDKKPTG